MAYAVVGLLLMRNLVPPGPAMSRTKLSSDISSRITTPTWEYHSWVGVFLCQKFVLMEDYGVGVGS